MYSLMIYFTIFVYSISTCSFAFGMETKFSENQKRIISLTETYTDVPHRLCRKKFYSLEDDICKEFAEKKHDAIRRNLLDRIESIKKERISAINSLKESRAVAERIQRLLIKNKISIYTIPTRTINTEQIVSTFTMDDPNRPLSCKQKELINLIERYATRPHRSSFKKLKMLKNKIEKHFEYRPLYKFLLPFIDCIKIDFCVLILASRPKTTIDVAKCIKTVNCLGHMVRLQSNVPNNSVLQYLAQQLSDIELETLNKVQSLFDFNKKTYLAQSYLQKYHPSFISPFMRKACVAKKMIKKCVQSKSLPPKKYKIKWENNTNIFLRLFPTTECYAFQQRYNKFKKILELFQRYYEAVSQKRNQLIFLINKEFINHTALDLMIRLKDDNALQRIANLFEFIQQKIDSLYQYDCPEKQSIIQLQQQAIAKYNQAIQLKKDSNETL